MFYFSDVTGLVQQQASPLAKTDDVRQSAKRIRKPVIFTCVWSRISAIATSTSASDS
jgi:hypothetical protein